MTSGPAVAGVLAFGASLGLVPLCRAVSLRLGYAASPRADRWHSRPTALFGGVAIATAVLGLHLLLEGPRSLPVLVVGAGLMSAVGLLDDLVSLNAYTKLVAEIIIASVFIFFGYRLGWMPSATLDILLTLTWIVGLTNAFNLLDNMDGLCAGVTLIAGTALLVAAVLGGARADAVYLALLLGATAGFLVYNFHPASIFLGDSGSLFIGMNLAVLTLRLPLGGLGRVNVLSIIATPLLVLLVPIVDTALVTASRILSGRSAAQGGRDHSSHRLVAMGLSERAAVGVLWAIAALGGGLALAIHWFRADWVGVTAAVFILGTIIFAVYLSHVRVYDAADDTLVRSGRITPFVVDFLHKRRVAEVVLDVCLVSIAYYSAYRLRFEGKAFDEFYPSFLVSLPIVLGVQMGALFLVGSYRGVWKYFGLMDGVTFAKGVGLGALANVSVIVFLYRFEHYSRKVFIIYAALLLLMLVVSRASFRLMSEFASRQRSGAKRLVIYGAGDVGASAVRDMMSRSAGGYRMLGFIDDDPEMAQTSMQGYAVLGGYAQLTRLIQDRRVDIVVVTRLVDVDRLSALEALCTEHRVALSRLTFSLDQLVAAS